MATGFAVRGPALPSGGGTSLSVNQGSGGQSPTVLLRTCSGGVPGCGGFWQQRKSLILHGVFRNVPDVQTFYVINSVLEQTLNHGPIKKLYPKTAKNEKVQT